MAITCPICGAEYDSTLFEFGQGVRCRCGTEIEYPGPGLRSGHIAADASQKRVYEVWRQGDDGNPMLVQDGLTAEEADKMVAEFEFRGHKQMYWKSRAKVI